MTNAPLDSHHRRQIAKQQRPTAGALVLDHTAHFVPDINAAGAALERLGFNLTPFSAQQHRLTPDAPLSPAGSGNRCAMLRNGYLEFLTPTADTPIAQRMRAAIARYTGVHLVCFGTGESAGTHARLTEAGFDPQPPVALQRQIGTPDGEDTARFTVLRVPPEKMPEGRIQIVEHRTPELLWQPRWLDHPNRAVGLVAAIICVDDPDRAGERYARFADRPMRREGPFRVIETNRGRVVLGDPATLTARLGAAPPAIPWIAGVVLASEDIGATRAHLQRAGLAVSPVGAEALRAPAPPELGGIFLFQSMTGDALRE